MSIFFERWCPYFVEPAVVRAKLSFQVADIRIVKGTKGFFCEEKIFSLSMTGHITILQHNMFNTTGNTS